MFVLALQLNILKKYYLNITNKLNFKVEKLFKAGCTIFLLNLLFSSCIDRIEFNEPDALKNAISIQGKLTKGNPSQIRVQISNTFDFANTQRFITAKSVELINQEGGILDLKTKRQGIYELEIPENHPTFKIDYGKGYQLKVQLITGELIESAFDTLYPVPEIASLNVEKYVQETFNFEGVLENIDLLRFSINTSLHPENSSRKTSFLWELESVYKQSDTAGGLCRDGSCINSSGANQTCFLHINPVRNYKTLNAKKLTGDFLENFQLLEETQRNSLFAEGYYLTVYQQSLSDFAFDYWSKVGNVVNRTGNQFQSPAGRVPTNFSYDSNDDLEVLGFFFATESTFERIYISPAFANNPRTICPPPMGNNPLCCNCLCQPNATLKQPDWWME